MLLIEGVMGGQEAGAVVFILVKLVTYAQKGYIQDVHVVQLVNWDCDLCASAPGGQSGTCSDAAWRSDGASACPAAPPWTN